MDGNIQSNHRAQGKVMFCSWEGQLTPSLGQGRGAGWAMYVGYCCPGITTEKSDAYDVDTCHQRSPT